MFSTHFLLKQSGFCLTLSGLVNALKWAFAGLFAFYQIVSGSVIFHSNGVKNGVKIMSIRKDGIRMDNEKTVFERSGGRYEERDGLWYPVLFLGDGQQGNICTGKYGDLWMEYLKDKKPERYWC